MRREDVLISAVILRRIMVLLLFQDTICYFWRKSYYYRPTYVSDELRGQGMAKRLLKETVAWAREENKKIIHHVLLQKNRWKIIKIIMMYYNK